jgi:tRNA pseudouridine55 synthase
MKQSLINRLTRLNPSLQVKRIKRDISGVILLDKPLGFSSNQALQKIKYLLQAEKAGHTGSLDPLASGLLPLCFGEATKFSHYLLDADKSYRALVQLGATTTTGDAEGEVLVSRPVDVTEAQVKKVLNDFIGDIKQTPPMYSALKHQGKALYEYARDGVDIERAARDVTIYQIDFHGFQNHQLDITVPCSKGTYIRTLAEDIGAALGCGAHLAGLRRLTAGHFKLEDAITVEAFEAMTLEQRDACLLPPDATIATLPMVTIDADSEFYLLRGQSVWKAYLNIQGSFRVYNEQGVFLGLGEQAPDGKIAPKRLLKSKIN